VCDAVDDRLALLLHRDLLLGVLLPELEAVHKTVVLEPMDDARRLGLDRDLLLGAQHPSLK
jgi:hypothetical protein